MIISMSKRMMRRSFEKTLYRFTEIPEVRLSGTLGVYVHVPFCFSKCSFCPFYKEIFSQELKTRYICAIRREIGHTDMQGTAKWVYFGGGTPNTLATEDLCQIVEAIKAKARVNRMGIELLPATVTDDYLKGLKRIGFTKISVGVESFSDKVINRTGRTIATCDRVNELIALAKAIGLWVNVDMMVGLPNQDGNVFRYDMRRVSTILPDQVTIYPYMVIRGVTAAPSGSAREQFKLIEEASNTLQEHGYSRKGVWTFARGDDVYDSSRDELIEDYVGFGPAAFSTFGNWKVVNPELDVYIRSLESGTRMGFVAPKTEAADEWRRFARMMYDLRIDGFEALPLYIRLFLLLLRLTGYSKKKVLTEKGLIFAHEITKEVVESLPFPVQNPGCVENYDQYLSCKTVK